MCIRDRRQIDARACLDIKGAGRRSPTHLDVNPVQGNAGISSDHNAIAGSRAGVGIFDGQIRAAVDGEHTACAIIAIICPCLLYTSIMEN